MVNEVFLFLHQMVPKMSTSILGNAYFLIQNPFFYNIFLLIRIFRVLIQNQNICHDLDELLLSIIHHMRRKIVFLRNSFNFYFFFPTCCRSTWAWDWTLNWVDLISGRISLISLCSFVSNCVYILLIGISYIFFF